MIDNNNSNQFVAVCDKCFSEGESFNDREKCIEWIRENWKIKKENGSWRHLCGNCMTVGDKFRRL